NDVVSVRFSGVDKITKDSNQKEFRINNEYRIGQPKGALTILDEQSNFIGFIISKPKKKGRSEIAYALSHKYWDRGIGQSVLSKMLEQFSATVRPKNVSSWCIRKKVGFEPVLADESINFENKGYDLLLLDNLLNYCKNFEEFINKLNYTGDIEASKLYTQENDKNV
ncbi:27719_t:CDS:2, partial [Dentiscutata erythropus]